MVTKLAHQLMHGSIVRSVRHVFRPSRLELTDDSYHLTLNTVWAVPEAPGNVVAAGARNESTLTVNDKYRAPSVVYV